ncbi:MAG: LysM peptidoglycan-binding domain-containing M23 family metallopeptidase [Chloroflexi bacterium]|nr:LysM peptidoglycan-binding domain-containing M23 family metallopeptidase [Chloroflexota bacterium]
MTRIWNILLVAGCVLSIAATFIISVKPAGTSLARTVPVVPAELAVASSLPPLNTNSLPSLLDDGITRRLQLKTVIPKRASNKVTKYVVQMGDSPWSIAEKFGLKPETILWSNDELNASAGSLKTGDPLMILPVDGVLHIVKEGDTLETLEGIHGTPTQEIFEFIGNNFDLTQPPQLTIGQQIIIPNGYSTILWSEAQVPVVSMTGSGGGYSSDIPNLGSGYFIWPVNVYGLSQEYWSGHPGIDLTTDFRQPVFASDSGTVVFSGWDDTGYGNFIVIDHGNGFQTTYGHNEANLVATGHTVVKGQQIAESGNTGNSTGNHLDFRILLNGAFLNPLGYLP